MASSTNAQDNKQSSSYDPDIAEFLATPLQQNFPDGVKNNRVAFMTSPSEKTVDIVSRQGSANMQFNSFAISSGAPSKQYANFPPFISGGINRSFSEGSALVSPVPLSPGLAQKLREICENDDLDSQSYVAQTQQLFRYQPASTAESLNSGMRLGPQRSRSAIQVPGDSNLTQLANFNFDTGRQLEAARLLSNGIEMHRGRPQSHAQRTTKTADGNGLHYRPSLPSVPNRSISQPVNNFRNPQQSVEIADERSLFDFCHDSATNDLVEERHGGSKNNLFFDNIKQALASQQPRNYVDPCTDRTFPTTDEAGRKYVEQLLSAMYDLKEATDSDKVKKAWKDFLASGHDHSGIEVTCWILMESTKRAHRQEEPLVPSRSKNSKGKTKFPSFQAHINAICNGMKQHKTICQHLMAPEYSDGYIDNPIAGADRVGNNRKVNLKKKQTIDRGRLAEQHSRQNSELPVTQRQSTQSYRQPSYQTLASTEQDDPEVELTHVKHNSSPDARPKVVKSRKRKSIEAAADPSRKKSRSSRTSTFPIQRFADGRHYVLDEPSEQCPVPPDHSHPSMFQPTNLEHMGPNAATHAGNVARPEPMGPSRNHPLGQIYQHNRQVQQSYDEQDYQQPRVLNENPYQRTFDGAVYERGNSVNEDLDMEEDNVAEDDCSRYEQMENEGAEYNEADFDQAGHTSFTYDEPPCDELSQNGPVHIESNCEEPVQNDPVRVRSARERPMLAPLKINNQMIDAPLSGTYHDLKSSDYHGKPLDSAQFIDVLFNNRDLPDPNEFSPPTPSNGIESSFFSVIPEPICTLSSNAGPLFENALALPRWYGGDEPFSTNPVGSFYS